MSGYVLVECELFSCRVHWNVLAVNRSCVTLQLVPIRIDRWILIAHEGHFIWANMTVLDADLVWLWDLSLCFHVLELLFALLSRQGRYDMLNYIHCLLMQRYLLSLFSYVCLELICVTLRIWGKLWIVYRLVLLIHGSFLWWQNWILRRIPCWKHFFTHDYEILFRNIHDKLFLTRASSVILRRCSFNIIKFSRRLGLLI